MQVVVPEKLQKDLKAAMEKAGIPVPSPDRWEDALNALRVRPLPLTLSTASSWSPGRSPFLSF